MVPGCPELSAQESIGPGLTRRNRTFVDTIRPIRWVGPPLPKAMPVHTSAVDLQAVLDLDLKGVAPFRTYDWAWILPIDRHHQPRDTIRRHGSIGDFEIVLDNVACIWPVGIIISGDREPSSPAASAGRTIDATGILSLYNIAVIQVTKLCTWLVLVIILVITRDISRDRQAQKVGEEYTVSNVHTERMDKQLRGCK